jgi:hypothetical protein
MAGSESVFYRPDYTAETPPFCHFSDMSLTMLAVRKKRRKKGKHLMRNAIQVGVRGMLGAWALLLLIAAQPAWADQGQAGCFPQFDPARHVYVSSDLKTGAHAEPMNGLKARVKTASDKNNL